MVNWYQYLEKNKFITIALESSGIFKAYEYVDVNDQSMDDNKYIIDTMAEINLCSERR